MTLSLWTSWRPLLSTQRGASEEQGQHPPNTLSTLYRAGVGTCFLQVRAEHSSKLQKVPRMCVVVNNKGQGQDLSASQQGCELIDFLLVSEPTQWLPETRGNTVSQSFGQHKPWTRHWEAVLTDKWPQPSTLTVTSSLNTCLHVMLRRTQIDLWEFTDFVSVTKAPWSCSQELAGRLSHPYCPHGVGSGHLGAEAVFPRCNRAQAHRLSCWCEPDLNNPPYWFAVRKATRSPFIQQMCVLPGYVLVHIFNPITVFL